LLKGSVQPIQRLVHLLGWASLAAAFDLVTMSATKIGANFAFLYFAI
jgi:hypothetical protein